MPESKKIPINSGNRGQSVAGDPVGGAGQEASASSQAAGRGDGSPSGFAPRDLSAALEADAPEADDPVTAGSDTDAAETGVAGVAAADLDEVGADEPVEPEPGDGDELAAERDAYRDSLLRLKAEFENYRKRAHRELTEARTRGRAEVLAEFLPVIDNLDRALNAAEHHDEGQVLEGVRLTHALFAQLLRREGVSEVSPLGELFDPRLHEAMMASPSPEPEGTVIAVMEPGYVMEEQVLRPAKVAVSSGPAEA